MIKINDFNSINTCYYSVLWITIYVYNVLYYGSIALTYNISFDLSTAIKTKIQTVKIVCIIIGVKIIDGIGLFRISMLENRTV